ncbi:nitronate monooxygenase [Streptomyces sp. AJS327]|uniref:nitronate monooxygenase n=1 Tax=Streptomyces sp. AJS327 TaxID=2545265 RepID=UPI0015DF4CA4|nr:nitronate monooxygenase [Streptomyces sp. AJS327]MBA0049878.1 nitronate monooxygenase [Streptomyces sp. AJS327]
MSTWFAALAPYPVVQAPMAGGTSGPRLAAAVSGAGGLGSLAAGYKSPAAMRDEVRELRGLTDRPFAVNLFMPQPPTGDPAAVEVYREQLAPEAAWYEVPLGSTDGAADDAYQEKLAVLLDEPVPVVSFTFGCPSPEVLERLARAGSQTVVTATTLVEALAAEEAGADAVCLQGTEAGGHQSTHVDSPRDERNGGGLGLLALLTQVRETVRLPLIAAGGLMRGGQVAAVLAAGASAAQLGTAFLICPESGAHPLHKRALLDPVFTRTEITRAFSGRPARGLTNRFIEEHGRYAPAAYPQVHYLTAGLRKAAAAAGDPQAMALWAGQGHRLARELPAARLVEVLVAELAEARHGLTARGGAATRDPGPGTSRPGTPEAGSAW